MSTVASPETTELRRLRNLFTLLRKDLVALPEEVIFRKFGPNVRTVADFLYEYLLANDHVGYYLRRQSDQAFEWPTNPQWLLAPADWNTKDRVLAEFDRSSNATLELVGGFTPEQMLETIPNDDGETTRAERCHFMHFHGWYHMGQINYIQTLVGDTAWHWME